jgi:hypothetical protein
VRGVLRYYAQETTIDSVVQAERSLAVAYEPVASPVPRIPGQAPRPDLVAASDTGDSDSDNITTDTTPTFLAELPQGEPHDSQGAFARVVR